MPALRRRAVRATTFHGSETRRWNRRPLGPAQPSPLRRVRCTVSAKCDAGDGASRNTHIRRATWVGRGVPESQTAATKRRLAAALESLPPRSRGCLSSGGDISRAAWLPERRNARPDIARADSGWPLTYPLGDRPESTDAPPEIR